MAFSYTDIKKALDLASSKTAGKFQAFDVAFYQANYTEVRDAGGVVVDDSLKNYSGDPLQHYVEIGAAKGYAPNPRFDAAFYKSQYADLVPYSGADLLAHYALFGAYEGRAPTAILKDFNGPRYLSDYPDVAAYVTANLADFLGSVTNGAIAHYVLFGAAEQRQGFTTVGLNVENQAPTVPTPQNIAVDATIPYVFKLADFPFADADGDQLEKIELVSLPQTGGLKLGSTTLATGATVTRAQLEAGQLSYVAEAGSNGQQSFDFRVCDQYNASDAARLKLDVLSNHAPTTQDTLLTLNKNVAGLTLKASDFPFADVDGGDSLKAVVISVTPDSGVLKLNGALVLSGSNTQVSLQQLNEGKLVFSPPPFGWEGLATFEFKVLDQADASATGKLKVAVGNVAPTTQAAQVSVEKNLAYTFKTDDFPFADANGDLLGGVLVKTLPGLGSLKLNGTSVTAGQTVAAADLAGGKLVYTPDVEYNGQQSFSFQVRDAVLASSASMMTLVVGNRPPATAAASVSLDEDTSYTFKSADFPFNDADGNALAKLELVSLPVDGQLRLNGVAQMAGAQISATDLAAGKLVYVPTANANGTRSFDFKVWDQQAASSAATLSLTITPLNDAPATVAAKVVTAADTAYVFKQADFIFTDVDTSDTLQAVVVASLPESGVLKLDGAVLQAGSVVTSASLTAGKLTYVPATGFNGKASFEFKVKDAALESGSALMSLAVGNQAPATQNAQLAVPDVSYVFKSADFPFQDDNPGDTLQALAIISLPGSGALKLDGVAVKAGDTVMAAQLAAGKLSYTAATGFSGQTSFGFQVQDAALSSNAATLTLNVGNHAPTTQAASVSALENTHYTFKLADFPFADVDAGDRLEKLELLSLPATGQIKLSGAALTAGASVTRADLEAGKLVFAPAADANGAVSFDFRVSDALSSSSAAKMTVNVSAVNEAPNTSNKQLAATEDTAYVFGKADFPFTDADGDTLQALVVDSLPASGSLKLNGQSVSAGQTISLANLEAGKFSFVPAANVNGNVSFGFKVRDAELASSAATMTLAVAAVQDAPVAKASSVTVDMGKTFKFGITSFGFEDADTGDSLQSVKIVSLPAKGLMLLNGSAVTAGTVVSKADLSAGKLSYTQDWPEKVSFSFSVNDGKADSSNATMSVDVESALALVSKTTSGGFGVLKSEDPDLSFDGRYVVFTSSSANFVSGDGNVSPDVYLRDMQTGTMSLVSVGPQNALANDASGKPSISADGKTVVFSSMASNLVTGDTNTMRDIFAYSTASKTVVLVSKSQSGSMANGSSDSPVVSSDGKYVAFVSVASNLTAGSVNSNGEVFVKNLTSGAVERVSAPTGAGAANGACNSPAISADGLTVAFDSVATNLASGDSNGYRDIFVRKAGVTMLVSASKNGALGNGSSSVPLLTAAGDKVAFSSNASNLVSSDTNGVGDVFLKTLSGGDVVRVSESSSGQQANAASTLLSISADGRYVAFSSAATNLVSGDTNGKTDVFVKDTSSGALLRISVSDSGVQGNGDTLFADLSGDGAFVAFSSTATNLVTGDANGVSDVFWGAWGS
jgi:hypothetical protein